MLRFGAISDLHGIFPQVKKDLDYLFIAGDIVPLTIQNNSLKCLDWFEGEFIPWCSEIKAKVIFIGGNHDKFLENDEFSVIERINTPNITYLSDNYFQPEDNFYEDDFIVVYGTPLCKQFGRWSFMRSQQYLEELWSKVEFPETDKYTFILSHDAPYGVSDVLLQQNCPWANGEHIGNPALRHLIERTEPDFNIHGHLHSTNHEFENLGRTKVICSSILNEDYKLDYHPRYFCIG